MFYDKFITCNTKAILKICQILTVFKNLYCKHRHRYMWACKINCITQTGINCNILVNWRICIWDAPIGIYCILDVEWNTPTKFLVYTACQYKIWIFYLKYSLKSVRAICINGRVQSTEKSEGNAKGYINVLIRYTLLSSNLHSKISLLCKKILLNQPVLLLAV